MQTKQPPLLPKLHALFYPIRSLSSTPSHPIRSLSSTPSHPIRSLSSILAFSVLSLFPALSFAQSPTPTSIPSKPPLLSPSASPMSPTSRPTSALQGQATPSAKTSEERIAPFSSIEAQKRMLLQEDIKLDPTTLKELEFALPPKDCSRPCQEALASILYHTALRFRRIGYTRMARSYLQHILLYYTNTRIARIAKLHLLQWDTQKESYRNIQQNIPLSPNGLDQRGRVEFIVMTSLYGIYFGAMMPFAFISANNPGNGWVGLSLLGFTAAAVVSSILGTMNSEMTPGQASSASVGMFWGLLTGGMLLAGFSGSNIQNEMFKFFFLGPLLGYAAGVIIPRFARPTAGQIALGSSMGAWLAGYTGLIWGSFITGGARNISPWSLVIPLLISAYGGLFGGIFLQNKLDWSRSRTLFVNLGGILGIVLAGGIFTLASVGGTFNTPALLITILLSSLAGKVLTFFLTGSMPTESSEEGTPRKTASLGALANYSDGQWSLGAPIPILTNDPTAPGTNRVEIHVPLLRGQW